MKTTSSSDVTIDSIFMMAQIGIHYGGTFYEFVPWNGVVTWEIAPWGYWSISAENETHKVLVCMSVPVLFYSLLT